MEVESPFLSIDNSCDLSDGAGCFYWVRGRPMSAAQSYSNHLLLLPRDRTWKESFVETKTILIEGPFGPNIGIYSWLCHNLSKLLERKSFLRNGLSLDTIRDLLRRPAQLPKGEKICFFVDSSATFRSQTLWHYLDSLSLGNDKQVDIYLLGTTPDEVSKKLFSASSCSCSSCLSCSFCSDTTVYSLDEIKATEFGKFRKSVIVSEYY